MSTNIGFEGGANPKPALSAGARKYMIEIKKVTFGNRTAGGRSGLIGFKHLPTHTSDKLVVTHLIETNPIKPANPIGPSGAAPRLRAPGQASAQYFPDYEVAHG